jgi:surface antigen
MPAQPSPVRSPVRFRVQALAAAVLALSISGCSFSYQLGSLFEKNKDGRPAEQTGSVAAEATAAAPDAEDLDAARAVATELLSRGKDTSLPWENPRTGARGTVTPIAAAHDQDGQTCRDFLASYVRASAEAWLEGEACRGEAGRWEVRSLKPWRRS